MRRSPRLPPPFQQLPYRRCPSRLRHPRLVAGTFPLLACPSFLECYVPYAGSSSSALDQFFPDDIGLRLCYPGSAPRKWYHNGFTWGCRFRRGRHSVMLWPSRLLALLAVRHRNAAPEGLYSRAFSRFVTSSTVEYATRPTGRLPGLVFHQQEGQPFRLTLDAPVQGIFGPAR